MYFPSNLYLNTLKCMRQARDGVQCDAATCHSCLHVHKETVILWWATGGQLHLAKPRRIPLMCEGSWRSEPDAMQMRFTYGERNARHELLSEGTFAPVSLWERKGCGLRLPSQTGLQCGLIPCCVWQLEVHRLAVIAAGAAVRRQLWCSLRLVHPRTLGTPV